MGFLSVIAMRPVPAWMRAGTGRAYLMSKADRD
jgi:hypothetical protein